MRISVLSKIILFILIIFIFSVLLVGFCNTDLKSLKELFYNKEFLLSVWFSLETAFIATILSLIFGIPIGLYLARNKSFFASIADVFFDLPIVVPPLIVGVFLLTYFNSSLIKNLYPFMFSMWGAIIAQFFVSVPLTIKSAKNSFILISPIYEMIATTLGSRPKKSFYDTTFKIALPGILSGLTLTWIRCMGEFGATLMIGGGIPCKTENIPINIYLNVSSGNFKMGIAGSILAITIATLCIMTIKLLFLSKRNKYKL